MNGGRGNPLFQKVLPPSPESPSPFSLKLLIGFTEQVGRVAYYNGKPVVIGILTVEYVLHGNESLKGKRRVANSLKQKVRNTFNVAIAEMGTEDSLSRLRLVVVSLSNSERHLTSRLTKCLAHMEAVCDEEMVYSDIEFVGV